MKEKASSAKESQALSQKAFLSPKKQHLNNMFTDKPIVKKNERFFDSKTGAHFDFYDICKRLEKV